MTRPSKIVEWGTGSIPAGPVYNLTQQKNGWPVGYQPPAQWLNEWQNAVYQWIDYLDLRGQFTFREVFNGGLSVEQITAAMDPNASSNTAAYFFLGGAAGNVYLSVGAGYWTKVTSGSASAIRCATSLSISGNLIVGGDGGLISKANSAATSWTTQTSQFTASNVLGLASKASADLLVAVGQAGKISSSTDGATWTARTSGVGTDLLGVIWCTFSSEFIAWGKSGVILTSPDGITWTSRTSQFGASDIQKVIESGLLIAVGAGGKVSTSSDGHTWTARTSGSSNTITSVAQVAGGPVVAVAGGDAKVLTSPDYGVTWSSVASGVTWSSAPQVVYCVSYFAVFDSNLAGTFVSTDMVSWKTITGWSMNASTPVASSTVRHAIVYQTNFGQIVASPYIFST